MKSNQFLKINPEIRELSDEFSYITDSRLKKWLIMLCLNDVKNKTSKVIAFQKKIEELLLQTWSSPRKQIMNTLWLWRKLMENIHKYIVNRNFLDPNAILTWLRDFLISSYDSLDLIAYKYDETTENLVYYSWNKDLDISRIDIKNNKWYKNEILALKGEEYNPTSKYEDTLSWGLYCKKISLPWGEEIVLSFHSNSASINFNPDNIDLDIRRLVKLFQKNLLLPYLQKDISLIETRYKDKLTWAYNKTYAREIFKNRKYSAIFLDVTDFKNINDTISHYFWDLVLQNLVKILNWLLRDWDRVFRNWWDEFVVLVSSFDEEVVKSINERIHEYINNFDFYTLLCSNCKTQECKLACEQLLKKELLWPVRVKTWLHVYDVSAKLSLDELINKADIDMWSKESNEWKIHRIEKTVSLINNLDDIDKAIKILELRKQNIKEEILQKEEA